MIRILLPFMIAAPLAAQAPASAPVTWDAELVRSPAAAGPATLRVTARLDRGWKVYAITQPPGGPAAMRIMLDRGQGISFAGPVKHPVPARDVDPNFSLVTETYSGAPRFTLPVSVTDAARARDAEIRIRFQACSGTLCLPARTVTVPVRATAQAGA